MCFEWVPGLLLGGKTEDLDIDALEICRDDEVFFLPCFWIAFQPLCASWTSVRQRKMKW